MKPEQIRDVNYMLNMYRGFVLEETGYRIALAFPLDGGQRVEIICPFCGLVHRHSMPKTNLEPRLRHCLYKGTIGDAYLLHVIDSQMEDWVRAAAEALRPLAVELARLRRPVWW